MKAPLLSPSFKYINAQDSSKPGYLARRFAAIRKRQSEAEQEAVEKVRQIRVRK